MKKLDDLIDQIISEVRVYEGAEAYTEQIHDVSGVDYAREVVGSKEHTICAVRHQVFSPPEGFTLEHILPPGFPPGVQLPADVVHFYSRICHAELWWKGDYTLDPPGWSGREENADAANWNKIEPPHFLLRFCEVVYSEVYYALRTQDSGKHWDVILIVNDATDSEMALNAETFDKSFTEWLERMHKTDGWPPHGGVEEDPPGYYRNADKRMPTAEVMKQFGDPQKLLPPVKVEIWDKK